MEGVFSVHGRLENRLGRPAFTTEVPVLGTFIIVGLMSRVFLIHIYIYMYIYIYVYILVGVAGFPVALLFGGRAIVRVAFWYTGAGEPLPSTSWQLVR